MPTASSAPKLGAWKRLPDQPTFKGAVIQDVLAGGPGYIAVGCAIVAAAQPDRDERCDAAAWTSINGLTWTRSTEVGGVRDARMRAAVAGGPGFVAVGTETHNLAGFTGTTFDAAVWTSRDGIEWSRVPFSEGFKYATGNDVVVLGTRLIASGASLPGQDGGPPAVWTSSNGRDWRREKTTDFQGFTDAALGVVGDRLVLSGLAGAICAGNCRRQVWTSPNGAQWTRVPDSPAFDGAVTLRPELEFQGRMLASGVVAPVEGLGGGVPQTRAAAWSSADAVAWERVTIPAPKRSSMVRILSLESALIAVGAVQDAAGSVTQAITWTSTDGRTWKLETADPALRRTMIRNMLVTGKGLIAFGGGQLDGPGEHTGMWLCPVEPR